MMFIKQFFVAGLLLACSAVAVAQDTDALIKKVRDKLGRVNDYQAEGVLKTDVSFMKVPESKVTVYYKKPDRFRIKKPGGISIVPKGGMNINLGALFEGDNYTVVPAGKDKAGNTPVTIVKLLPLGEKSDVVVATLYIEEKEGLIHKAVITTRENGTYELEMIYGAYAKQGLPDKVVFIFATKEYKLPKGLSFDYDTGETPKSTGSEGSQKGKLEINYTSYTINKGIPDSFFQ